MTNKALKKFSRKELLEILVSQSKEIEQLRERLRMAESQLENREIAMKNAGSMAEAALQLNHIFQDADAAARQYLESLKGIVEKEREVLNRLREKELKVKSECTDSVSDERQPYFSRQGDRG